MDYIIYVVVCLLILPTIIYASVVQSKVNSTFENYKKVAGMKGISAKEACEIILRSTGVNDVKVVATSGHLTDNYNPTNKTISLSSSVYSSTSIASLGVAVHEVGHAIQHATGYKPLKVRSVLIKVSNVCSALLWPMIILGFFLSMFSYFYYGVIFMGVGMVFYGISMLIAFATYPVEKDASKRALKLLVQNNILDTTEVKGAEVVLNAAAKTYLASLLINILFFLRFLFGFIIATRD